MTTDKAFKRVVRARMAKTGERYAAARRTLVEGAMDGRHAKPTADAAAAPSGYRMRGGLHPETATLANVLANQGVTSGLTGEPLTEAAILGIGGGLGAGYILWEFQKHSGPVLTVGFRNQWQYPWFPGWTAKTLDRLGIEPDRHETGGAKGAREALAVTLARDRGRDGHDGEGPDEQPRGDVDAPHPGRGQARAQRPDRPDQEHPPSRRAQEDP